MLGARAMLKELVLTLRRIDIAVGRGAHRRCRRRLQELSQSHGRRRAFAAGRRERGRCSIPRCMTATTARCVRSCSRKPVQVNACKDGRVNCSRCRCDAGSRARVRYCWWRNFTSASKVDKRFAVSSRRYKSCSRKSTRCIRRCCKKISREKCEVVHAISHGFTTPISLRHVDPLGTASLPTTNKRGINKWIFNFKKQMANDHGTVLRFDDRSDDGRVLPPTHGGFSDWDKRPHHKSTSTATTTAITATTTTATTIRRTSVKTASPIKHVIVLIGENRGLDHTFGVYKPKGKRRDHLQPAVEGHRQRGRHAGSELRARRSSSRPPASRLTMSALRPIAKSPYNATNLMPQPNTDGTPTAQSDTRLRSRPSRKRASRRTWIRATSTS